METERPRPTLRDLALVFLRLGATAFGGPAAHIALMEEEVVRRRRWLSREEFLDLLAATHLIPGPNSTEMAIHVGMLAGWLGLIVAGVCFILPAAILVTFIAWAYVEYGTLPAVQGFLYGVKPVIVAVVMQALVAFASTSIKSAFLGGVGVVVAALNWHGVDELVLLLGAGSVVALSHAATRRRGPVTACVAIPALPLRALVPFALGTTPVAFGLGPLFWFFLKVGSVLFGSGYVLIAFLRADLVERWGWLTEQQLLDAIAVGQFTPGPVFTTATFIGYVLGGLSGALAATVGIFLPAFFFVALSGPIVARLRRSPVAGAFLDGVVVASLALMAVVAWNLGQASLVDAFTMCLAVASAVILVWGRINSAWLVLGGGLLGWAWTTV